MPTYVEREADHRLFSELLERHYCFLLTARQMGKSSLIVRTRDRLRMYGIAAATLDITVMGKGTTQQQWYFGHADEIARELGLSERWESWWEEEDGLGDAQRFGRFLTDFVLEEIGSDVVIFIDEIDSTIGLPYSDDYFALIRAMFNRRAQDPKLQRLTFVLVGVAAPADLIKDPQRTPFNIGQRIDLADFTLPEADALLQGLAPEHELARRLLERVLYWTGGHPYLTQRTCEAVATWAERQWDPARVPVIVDDCIKEIFFGAGRRSADSNLQVISMRLERADNRSTGPLLSTYRRVLRGERVADDDRDPIKIGLKLSGLVVPGPAGLMVRNRIYATVFDETWLDGVTGEFSSLATVSAEPEYDVFVSYSANDSRWVADALVPALQAAGLKVVSDIELLPGAEWDRELTRLRETSRFFLPVLSPDWVHSRWAQEEFALMSDRVGKIVPVLLRPTEVPLFLRTIQFADFTNPDQQSKSMQILLRALGGKAVEWSPSLATSAAKARSIEGDEKARLRERCTREQLLRLTAALFPELLDQIDHDTSHAAIASRIVDQAARTERLPSLRDAIDAGLLTPRVAVSADGQDMATSPLAVVIMPFGRKSDVDGRLHDFDRVYSELIRPALSEAGFVAVRVDEWGLLGDFRVDALQALALADLVVADISIDNANVWYMLGVRHSLRARGVVLLQRDTGAQRGPFDVYTDRRLAYPALEETSTVVEAQFVATLTAMARASAYGGESRRPVSPVFLKLHKLREPDWDVLVGDARTSALAQTLDDLHTRIRVAYGLRRGADLLVWAKEAPVAALRGEAAFAAGEVIRRTQSFAFALEQYDEALAVDQGHRGAMAGRVRCLERLQRFEEARDACRAWLDEHPNDAELWAAWGSVDKWAWVAGGLRDLKLLRSALAHYREAARVDSAIPAYAGSNAVVLWHVLRHLTGNNSEHESMKRIELGVRAALGAREGEDDPRSALMLANLDLLHAAPAKIGQAYRQAVARFDKGTVSLGFVRENLEMLERVAFRPPAVKAAVAALRDVEAIAAGPRPKAIAFFGHTIDVPSRPVPRFPSVAQASVAAAIDRVLGNIGASSADVGIAMGCNGGDLLFAEACVRRAMQVELLLPMAEDAFVSRYVAVAGEDWRRRFYIVKANASVAVRVQPQELRPLAGPPDSDAAWARNTKWLKSSAFAHGPENSHLLLLWESSIDLRSSGRIAATAMEFQQRTGKPVTFIDPQSGDCSLSSTP